LYFGRAASMSGTQMATWSMRLIFSMGFRSF
jgi:hypothetical protein